MVDCPRCGGSGKVEDNTTIGCAMRKLREGQKVTLRAIARRLEVSPSYVSELERGLKLWNAGIQKRYKDALGVQP